MTTRAAVAFTNAWWALKTRARAFARDQRGEVTATVILIAVFAALALTVGAIIVTKVTAKANSIPIDNTSPISTP